MFMIIKLRVYRRYTYHGGQDVIVSRLWTEKRQNIIISSCTHLQNTTVKYGVSTLRSKKHFNPSSFLPLILVSIVNRNVCWTNPPKDIPHKTLNERSIV